MSKNIKMMLTIDVTKKIFAVATGIFITFFAFYVYEKWEDAIDSYFNDAFSYLLRLKSEATLRLLKHK